MKEISIVIICRNEQHVIGRTLDSLKGITDDIILYDNGSTDATIQTARAYPVQIHEGAWEGFGNTKRKATDLARYDWILNLDADEAIDETLRSQILKTDFNNNLDVYELSFRNFIGNRYLRYGQWGGDRHVRIFNRNQVNWDDAVVHEQLILPANVRVKKLKGNVLHYTARNLEDFAIKMTKYAMLNAQKYFERNKRTSWLKLRFSAHFSFFSNYILKGGFMDGYAGYVCAKITAYYTFMKYARLKELNDSNKLKDSG